jgi:hypothetical protein
VVYYPALYTTSMWQVLDIVQYRYYVWNKIADASNHYKVRTSGTLVTTLSTGWTTQY